MKRQCATCNKRPALARFRGQYAVRPGHDMCQQCWRSALDSLAAESVVPKRVQNNRKRRAERERRRRDGQ